MKAVKKKLVIEIVYERKEDALELIRKIHYRNINDLKPMKVLLNNAHMQTELTFQKPLIEPRIEFINGNQCLIFPSSIND